MYMMMMIDHMNMLITVDMVSMMIKALVRSESKKYLLKYLEQEVQGVRGMEACASRSLTAGE